MKFTQCLAYRHPKYYYYASKHSWGLKKYKERFHKEWNHEIRLNAKLPIEDYVTTRKFEIPPGYIIKNPMDFMNEQKEGVPYKKLPKDRPWPFNKREEPGTRLDPNFKECRELVFNRKTRLLEGFKGAMNFTNTILESEDELPDVVTENEDKLVLDEKIQNMLDKRLEWCEKMDSRISRCNSKLQFPRLNKWATPKFGPSLDRKELNILTTYADCAELLVAKQSGHLYFPRIISPKYEIAFERNGHRCILDLRCDFITLKQNPVEEFLDGKANNTIREVLFDEAYETTKQEQLINIEPLNWEINFDPTHFYSDDEVLNKSTAITNQNIDTVYLGNNFNLHKKTPDRIIKGKLLLFLYGYAVGRARQLYGNAIQFNDPSNYKVLPQPITIKGVFANYSKHNLGFACLQLNTLSFDSDVKNQVWFEGPYDMVEDQNLLIERLALLNLHSYKPLSPIT